MAEDTRFAVAEAIEVGARIGIEWRMVDGEECRKGLAVEIEHGSHHPQADVSHDMLVTGKIAWAHIKAYSDDDSCLETMETEAQRHWAERGRTGH